MKTRRVGAYNGIYRLYDPRRRCYSLRIWFERTKAERAAKRWTWTAFERNPNEI